jgi:hypothetical protein
MFDLHAALVVATVFAGAAWAGAAMSDCGPLTWFLFFLFGALFAIQQGLA